MRIFVVVPCNWGNDFEDCHFVAARNPMEALALLNIMEDPNDKYRKDWMTLSPLNVYEIKGICGIAYTPYEIEIDLVNGEIKDRHKDGARVEKELREFLEKVKKVREMEKQNFERLHEDSAGYELDKAISEHIAKKDWEAIRNLIEKQTSKQ